MENQIIFRSFGIQPYQPIWQAMQDFIAQRGDDTPDECWLLQHEPVYTQGLSGKAEHILNPGNIPIIQADRGGQVTYHGPGQLVAYTLVDIKRRNLAVRDLVCKLEQSVIALLAEYDVEAQARCDARGVYVAGAKICSIGLRIRRGCSYHGLALNVNMDLSPFKGINPCGYSGLEMVQMIDLGIKDDFTIIQNKLAKCLSQQLNYDYHSF